MKESCHRTWIRVLFSLFQLKSWRQRRRQMRSWLDLMRDWWQFLWWKLV